MYYHKHTAVILAIGTILTTLLLAFALPNGASAAGDSGLSPDEIKALSQHDALIKQQLGCPCPESDPLSLGNEFAGQQQVQTLSELGTVHEPINSQLPPTRDIPR
jgi:hypothetical protein